MTDVFKLKMIVLAGLLVLIYVMTVPRSAEFNGTTYTLKGPIEVTQSLID